MSIKKHREGGNNLLNLVTNTKTNRKMVGAG